MKTIVIDGYPYINYEPMPCEVSQLEQESAALLAQFKGRRSIRDFSPDYVPKAVIENLLLIAGTAPSGANKQPWTFCAISAPEMKKQIREAAEQEEKLSYQSRMNSEWIEDLKPLGTDWRKPFLETAPWLIVVFKKSYDLQADGSKAQVYYPAESVGLACGFLISAIHNLGLCTLTHTPSPMGFLSQILNRPKNEKPFLLLPVGLPASPCYVPHIVKKPLSETAVWF